MNQAKWSNFIELVKNQFTVIDQGDYQTDIPGETVQFIEWHNGTKDMRAELHLKPKVVDKKTFYSNRIGSTVKEEYVYAPDETVEFTKFFEKNPSSDDWQEVDLAKYM